MFSPSKRPYLPPISYVTLTKILDKSPEEILNEMINPNFQLTKFLNDKRMQKEYDWVVSMTKLLEKVTQTMELRENIVNIFEQIPNTLYLEGIYDAVRHIDPSTNQMNFNLISSFLHVSFAFLSMMPYSADGLTKIIERIELQMSKNKVESMVCMIV